MKVLVILRFTPRAGCISPKLSPYEAFPLSYVLLSLCDQWGEEMSPERRHPNMCLNWEADTPPEHLFLSIDFSGAHY